jgi:NHS family xanthosine MFS transporter
VIIDQYFTRPDHSLEWHGIWMTFATYSLIVAVLFMVLFQHKHRPEALENLPVH